MFAKPSSLVADAAPVLASLVIAARLVEISTVLPFIFVDTKSHAAAFTLNATSPSFKDWLDTVPLSAPREMLHDCYCCGRIIYFSFCSCIKTYCNSLAIYSCSYTISTGNSKFFDS